MWQIFSLSLSPSFHLLLLFCYWLSILLLIIRMLEGRRRRLGFLESWVSFGLLSTRFQLLDGAKYHSNVILSPPIFSMSGIGAKVFKLLNPLFGSSSWFHLVSLVSPYDMLSLNTTEATNTFSKCLCPAIDLSWGDLMKCTAEEEASSYSSRSWRSAPRVELRSCPFFLLFAANIFWMPLVRLTYPFFWDLCTFFVAFVMYCVPSLYPWTLPLSSLRLQEVGLTLCLSKNTNLKELSHVHN